MEKSRSLPQYTTDLGLEEEERRGTYNFNGPSVKGDGFAPPALSSTGNPEMKRKKRIASYNMFATEGKLKSSLRGSVKWVKTKLADFRYGL